MNRSINGFIITFPLEVFIESNDRADFIRQKLNFIHKNDKFAFLGLRSNVGPSSIAHWQARGRLPEFMFVIVEFVSLFWLRLYKCKF